MPEVILGEGKTRARRSRSRKRILGQSDRLLVTRLDPATARDLLAAIPDAQHHELARCVTVERTPSPKQPGVAVLCAGTADLPVAEEAAITAGMAGCAVERVYDVVWRGCTGCWISFPSSTRRAPSSSSPGWKAHCRAWSPDW